MKKLSVLLVLSLLFINILFSQGLLQQPQRSILNNDYQNEFYETILNGDQSVPFSGIKFDENYPFNDTTTGHTSSAALSSNKFVVAYRDFDNNKNGMVVLGTVVNDSIYYSSKQIFNQGYSGNFSCIEIDSVTFVITCCDGGIYSGGDGILKSMVGKVVDTTITLGPVNESGNATQWVSSAKIDGNHFLRISETSNGLACIGEITGNTIAFSGGTNFDPEHNGPYFAAVLTPSKFVAVNNDGMYSDDDGKAVLGNINNGVITFGNEFTFCTDNAAYFRVTNLDTNTFVITYPEHTSQGDMGTACIGTVVGDSLEFGDRYHFNRVVNHFYNPLRLDNEHFIVTYNNFYDSVAHGSSRIGAVIGDSISYSPSYWFDTVHAANISTTLLDENNIFVAYAGFDNGLVYYIGKGIIGTFYNIETIMDTISVCNGSFEFPVRIKNLYNISESHLQISYDTSVISYNGFQNFSSNIPFDSLNVIDNMGVIDIFWHTNALINLESDTLIELLFIGDTVTTEISTHVTFTDTACNYLYYTGEEFKSDYYNGLIQLDPIPELAGNIYGSDSVCQGSVDVGYNTSAILNATSYVWSLTPDTAGNITGGDTTISISFSDSYTGLSTLSLCGVNDCGNGDTSFFNISVLGFPYANAGYDTSICENQTVPLVGMASNYSSTLWITMGDGFFDNPQLLNAIYTPGNYDISTGIVHLILSANPLNPCSLIETDTMMVNIFPLPDQPQTPIGQTIIYDITQPTDYYIESCENAYEYYWGLLPFESGTVLQSDTTATIYWNETYNGDSAYLFVDASNICGINPSDTLSIYFDHVGISENNNSNLQISVRPNISSGIFNILIDSDTKEIDLNVISSKGLLLHQYKINIALNKKSFQLDLQNHPSGIYYLHFNENGYLVVKKVVVNSLK